MRFIRKNLSLFHILVFVHRAYENGDCWVRIYFLSIRRKWIVQLIMGRKIFRFDDAIFFLALNSRKIVIRSQFISYTHTEMYIYLHTFRRTNGKRTFYSIYSLHIFSTGFSTKEQIRMSDILHSYSVRYIEH